MAENSKIGWCDHTVNLWWGCYEVHKGCDNCYAKKLANRYHGEDALWQQQGPRMYIKSAFADLKKYQARAAKEGIQYIVFMNSMSDIFEKPMPVVDFKHQQMRSWRDPSKELMTDEIREHFFNIVDCSPNLLFLLLTKRPSNIAKMVPANWLINPRKNVMYGTSVVDQDTADTLIPQLLKVPGYHFLSMEPLVGPVQLQYIQQPDGTLFPLQWRPNNQHGINWIIVGGESGSMLARPMNQKWVADISGLCRAYNIPFFLKQWGNWMPLSQPTEPVGLSQWADGSRRFNHYEQSEAHKYQRSNDQIFYYTNSHNEDGLLFGVEHKNFPITVWPH